MSASAFKISRLAAALGVLSTPLLAEDAEHAFSFGFGLTEEEASFMPGAGLKFELDLLKVEALEPEADGVTPIAILASVLDGDIAQAIDDGAVLLSDLEFLSGPSALDQVSRAVPNDLALNF